MKFIHVSDIHIGANPDPTMFWANDRALDIKESFANVIEICKNEKANVLLISGDLFNHQPTTPELNEVNDLFKTIPDTKVIIVAGANDFIKPHSPILNFTFSENVFYFLNQMPDEIAIKDTKIIIHGFSYHSSEERKHIIDSLSIDNDDNIHILLAYAGDSRHCPFDTNKLAKKNFSYIALGSNHTYQEVIDNKAYYAGSLEPIASNETGEHGIIIGDINEKTKRVQNIEFRKIAKASYITLNIQVNGSMTEDELVEMVTSDVLKHGSNNIYNIVLTGMKDPDVEFSQELFSKKIKIVNFEDKSEPKYDFVKLSADHPQDMIGAYIRKMTSMSTELSDVEKKALYLGTHALIKSSDKF